jgi:hypothetical protein
MNRKITNQIKAALILLYWNDDSDSAITVLESLVPEFNVAEISDLERKEIMLDDDKI